MNNNDNKTDEMLKSYFGRNQESFVYTPSHKHYVRNTAVIAAILVVVLCISFVLNSVFSTESRFTITVAAAGTKAYTSMSVRKFYLSEFDMNFKEPQTFSDELVAGIITVSGEDIVRIDAKSEKGYGEFLVTVPDGFMHLDSHGEPKVYSEKDVLRLIYSSEELTEDEKNSAMWYIPTDESGTPVSTSTEISANREDTINLSIHFADGTSESASVSVTYPQGKLNMKVQ